MIEVLRHDVDTRWLRSTAGLGLFVERLHELVLEAGVGLLAGNADHVEQCGNADRITSQGLRRRPACRRTPKAPVLGRTLQSVTLQYPTRAE